VFGASFAADSGSTMCGDRARTLRRKLIGVDLVSGARVGGAGVELA